MEGAPLRSSLKGIEPTAGSGALVLDGMRVDHRSCHTPMPEQLMDLSNIHPVQKQVRGERMAQGMHRHRLGNACLGGGRYGYRFGAAVWRAGEETAHRASEESSNPIVDAPAPEQPLAQGGKQRFGFRVSHTELLLQRICLAYKRKTSKHETGHNSLPDETGFELGKRSYKIGCAIYHEEEAPGEASNQQFSMVFRLGKPLPAGKRKC